MKKLFLPHHFTVEGTEIKETKKYPNILSQEHPLYPWILPFLHALTSQTPSQMGMNFCMDFGVDKTDHSKGTERDNNRTATHCPRVVLLKPDFGTVIVADSDTNQCSHIVGKLQNSAQGVRVKQTPARKMDAHMMSGTFSNAGSLSWAICYD